MKMILSDIQSKCELYTLYGLLESILDDIYSLLEDGEEKEKIDEMQEFASNKMDQYFDIYYDVSNSDKEVELK